MAYGVGAASRLLFAKKFGFLAPRNPFVANRAVEFRKELERFYILHNGLDVVRAAVKRLSDTGCFRAVRAEMCLPCHGQRTQTNAGTMKRKKRGVLVRFRPRAKLLPKSSLIGRQSPQSTKGIRRGIRRR
jgi:small subunit ribosomal protein S13